MDSARRVNQVMTKGNYGTQAERYWAALRVNINRLGAVLQPDPHGRIGTRPAMAGYEKKTFDHFPSLSFELNPIYHTDKS